MRRFVSDRYSAVLLDLDGCLVDSNDAHARAWSDTFERFGRRVPAARIRRHIGKGGQELLRDFVTDKEHALLASAMGSVQTERYLARFRREVRPIPGAAAAVRAMRSAGVAIVLASSAQREVIQRSLALLRLDGVLTGVTSAEDVEKAKPFDDIFSLAIARYRLSAANALAVGDTPYDVAAAHQIGVACAAMRSGGFPLRTLRCAEHLFAGVGEMWTAGRHLFS